MAWKVYELATEVVRDYVKRNFVDGGMCVQFAIHDSENPVTHQRAKYLLPPTSYYNRIKDAYGYAFDRNRIHSEYLYHWPKA